MPSWPGCWSVVSAGFAAGHLKCWSADLAWLLICSVGCFAAMEEKMRAKGCQVYHIPNN